MISDTHQPNGYSTVSAYLVVPDPEALLEFAEKVLDGTRLEALENSEGKVQHGEIRIGDSVVMTGLAPDSGSAMPGSLHVYVPDAHATYQRALEAGATSLRPPETQFYGDCNAGVRDPQGNHWWFATRIETISAEELQRRAQSKW